MHAGSETRCHWTLAVGQIDGVERLPVTDQEPGRVVVGRLEALHEFLDGIVGPTVGGESQGQLPPAPFARVRSIGERPVGQSGHQPVGVHRQPGTSRHLVPSAQDPGTGFAQDGHGRRTSIETFVAVGPDHQRCLRVESENHDQETHENDRLSAAVAPARCPERTGPLPKQLQKQLPTLPKNCHFLCSSVDHGAPMCGLRKNQRAGGPDWARKPTRRSRWINSPPEPRPETFQPQRMCGGLSEYPA